MPQESINKIRKNIKELSIKYEYLEKKVSNIDSNIDKKLEEINRGNQSLRLLISNIEKKLEHIDELKKENQILKKKIVELEKKISSEKPEKQVKKITLDKFLTEINKSLISFEEGTKVTKNKLFKVADVQIELKSFIDIEENGNIKMAVPSSTEEIDANLLSKINLKLSPALFKEEEWIELPNLIGISQKDAEKTLKKLGVKNIEIEKKESPYPSGTVIGQEPEPYTEIKEDVKVKLIISV